MCLSELLHKLKASGAANASKDRVHRAINEGVIDRPHLDRSLRYRFDDAHFTRLLEWLATLPSYSRRKEAVAT